MHIVHRIAWMCGVFTSTMYVCFVCVCACVRACVCVCMYSCICVCVCVCTCVHYFMYTCLLPFSRTWKSSVFYGPDISRKFLAHSSARVVLKFQVN